MDILPSDRAVARDMILAGCSAPLGSKAKVARERTANSVMDALVARLFDQVEIHRPELNTTYIIENNVKLKDMAGSEVLSGKIT